MQWISSGAQVRLLAGAEKKKEKEKSAPLKVSLPEHRAPQHAAAAAFSAIARRSVKRRKPRG
jgi:hypothetical protein